MDISKWTVEDFVFDLSFRKWLFASDSLTNLIWEEQLAKYPQKLKEVVRARELLVHLSLGSPSLSESEKNELWNKIEGEIHHFQRGGGVGSVIPLNANSTIQKMKEKQKTPFLKAPVYRVVAVLLICIGLVFLAFHLLHQETVPNLIPSKYTEHVTRPGVKSKLTLTDGSRVMLNSGSELYYLENFSADQRELFLLGEAYFEVFPDPDRPFIVHTGQISTKALGTSFSIHAYDTSTINVYLLTGEVAVSDASPHNPDLILRKGELAMLEKGKMIKNKFDEEQVTAWTKGVILFNNTPILEAIKILENWYGVHFEIKNMPDSQMRVSGKFDNEVLQNILVGLSYSTRFHFEIKDNKVMVNFITS